MNFHVTSCCHQVVNGCIDQMHNFNVHSVNKIWVWNMSWRIKKEDSLVTESLLIKRQVDHATKDIIPQVPIYTESK